MNDKKVTIINAQTDSIVQYLRKLWEFRNLAVSFAIRDIKIKYANTIIGLGWSVLYPFVAVGIFTFFFTYLFKSPTNGLPYPLFVFLGVNAWNFFVYIVHQGAGSIFENREVIKKVYFPRLILPISKILVGGLDFLIALVAMMVMMPFFEYTPSFNIFIFPLGILLNVLSGLTIAIWVVNLSVIRRDILHVIPFITHFGMWLTPVFYHINMFPKQWFFLFYINPMASVIEIYRWCLSGGDFPYQLLGFNLVILLGLFLSGFYIFRKTEDVLVDKL